MITPRGRQINALPAMLLAYGLARGLILVGIIPAWQGTDEPGHFEYALLLASRAAAVAGIGPDQSADPGTLAQGPIVRSLREHDFYRHTASKVPPTAADTFEEVPRLGTEVAQRGDETPIGYLPYAASLAFLPDGDVADVLRRLRFVSVALVLVLTLGAWRVATLVLPPNSASAAAAAALVVAGPMVGFAGSIVSPDLVAAALVATWFAVTARRLITSSGEIERDHQAGRSDSRFRWAIIAWILVFLAAAAKRTALFVIPLALLVEVMLAINGSGAGRRNRSGFLRLFSRSSGRDARSDSLSRDTQCRTTQGRDAERRDTLCRDTLHRIRLAARRPSALSFKLAAVLLTALCVGIGLTTRGGEAAGWQVAGAEWGNVRSASAAREGGWGLRIIDAAPDGWHYIERFVEIESADSGITTAPASATGLPIEVSAWIRSTTVDPAASDPQLSSNDELLSTNDEPSTKSAGTARASLVVDDGADVWLADLVDLPADGAWVQASVQGAVSSDTEVIRIAIVPGDGTIEGVGAIDADDVTLRLDGAAIDVNGGAERPTRRGTVWAEGLMRYTSAERLIAATLAGVVAPGAALDRGMSALGFIFRSAWGGYGWLTLWPVSVHYALAALLTLAAGAGCAVALFAPGWLVSDPERARFLRLCAVGAVLAVAATVVGSVAGAAAHKQPQGRYLIPALLPIALPMAALAERIAPGRGPLALAALAFWLDIAAIGWVMWPGFE